MVMLAPIGVIAAGELDAFTLHMIHRADMIAATADDLHVFLGLSLHAAHGASPCRVGPLNGTRMGGLPGWRRGAAKNS